MPSVNTVIFATRKKTIAAARARDSYGGNPLGRENEGRLYTRMRSGKEIRKWLRPRDSRSPDSNDFIPSPSSRSERSNVEDTIKIGVPCKEKRKKRGRMNTKQRVDRAPCNSLLETQRWLERSVAMRSASHRDYNLHGCARQFA